MYVIVKQLFLLTVSTIILTSRCAIVQVGFYAVSSSVFAHFQPGLSLLRLSLMLSERNTTGRWGRSLIFEYGWWLRILWLRLKFSYLGLVRFPQKSCCQQFYEKISQKAAALKKKNPLSVLCVSLMWDWWQRSKTTNHMDWGLISRNVSRNIKKQLQIICCTWF